MSLDFSRYPQSGDVLIDGLTVRPEGGTSSGPVVLYSPTWWLRRLLSRLIKRAEACNDYQRFYDGQQELLFASDKFRETYGRRFERFPANFMPLVVNAELDRLGVNGFRFGSSPSNDKGVWKIWQDNQLDAESRIAHEIALVKGTAYAAVDAFNPTPTITIEDPSETIVEMAPGNRRVRLAALKVYVDDDGYSRAYLYLPDWVYAYRSQNRRTDSTSQSLGHVTWEPYVEEDQDWPIANQLGVVPIVPLINRPRRDGTGRCEFEPVMGNQLAINFLRYSALIGSDTAALPQRWAKNLDLEVDTDTGQVKRPFPVGTDLLAARRPSPERTAEYGDKYPETEFGQFEGASLDPFVNLIRQEIGIMASNSETPYYYLLGQGNSNPPASEQTKSSEAPLVKKVEAQMTHFGEGWEETMRVALIRAGQRTKAAKATDAETDWKDPQTRNEGARTDAILKQYQAGLLPDEFALEELGYSSQQIERIKEMRRTEQAADTPPEPVE